jgi:Mlc titration factor MtfA (ptsG expression regulator)
MGTARPSPNHAQVSAYAYSNEHELLAVLAEHFFTSPELLKRQDPTYIPCWGICFGKIRGRCSR